MGAIFFANLYFLFSLFQKGQLKSYLLLNLFLLAITYFTSAFLYASWMADVFKNKFLVSHLFHPTIVQDSLPLLVFVLFFSFIYAGIKHLILARKFILLKKITFYSVALIFIIGAGFFINMQLDLKYKGDQQTMFIEQQYQSLDEVLQLPQFRSKVVYIDLWYSSCSPCIQEFQHLVSLKQQLKGEEIAYLYLARETSHPNSRQRWLNAVKKYNLQGWHIYMSKPLEQQVWKTILGNQQDSTTAAYPRYLLSDKNGNLVSYDAKRPSTGKEVVAQIKTLL
ncbi:TlpA family protein disulfide reductase [Rufibacter immobilis]|uniref:TlpA family protein disulfide reductase n=1 Tax=Rufibacter immobilis TaxID=1348778 RepID=UPI0035EBE972